MVAAGGSISVIHSFCGHVVERSLVRARLEVVLFLGAEFVNEPRAAVVFRASASTVIMKVIQTKLPLLMALSSANSLCVGLPSKIALQDIWEDIKNKYKIQSITLY